MKKLLLIALAAIAMFSFNSCKKDDGGDDPKPKEMRYVKSIVWKKQNSSGTTIQSKTEYEYDNQHRLIKYTVTGLSQNTQSKTVNFSYNGNTVIIKGESNSDNYEILLNDMGYPLSGKDGVPHWIYDANGYLQTFGWNTSGDGSVYHWENGNLTKLDDSPYDKETYEYGSILHPNTNLNLNGYEIVWQRDGLTEGLFLLPQGRHSTNLAIKRIATESTKLFESSDYTYTLDQNGYVTQIIEKLTREDGNNSTTYAEITYY